MKTANKLLAPSAISYKHKLGLEKKFKERGEIKIIAVLHQNAMRILLCEIEKIPLEYYRKINIKNGEIIQISFDGDSWSKKELLSAINITSLSAIEFES